VKMAVANEGPRLKRIRPAPMGRAFRYQRRMSNVLITVAEKKRPELAKTVGDEPETGAKGKKKTAKTATKTAAKKSSKPAAKPAAAKKKTAAKKSAK
jgi:large subunit ribosomal protein L22